MTADAGTDVEALAAIMHDTFQRGRDLGGWKMIARAILASDWFERSLAQARAEGYEHGAVEGYDLGCSDGWQAGYEARRQWAKDGYAADSMPRNPYAARAAAQQAAPGGGSS